MIPRFFPTVFLILVSTFNASSDHRRTQLVDQLARLVSAKTGAIFTHSASEKYGTWWTSERLPSSPAFRKIADSVRAQFSGSQNIDSAEIAFLEQVRKEPDNAEHVFALACAWKEMNRIESRLGRSAWEGGPSLTEHHLIEWLLAGVTPMPKSFEYARMRYLFECAPHHRPDLMGFGRLLLKTNPRDAEVEATILYQLGLSDRKADLDEALSIGLRMTGADPKDASLTGQLAFVYQSRWLRLGKRSSDGNAYIKWAKRYLALIPPQSRSAASVRQAIEVMRQDMAKQGAAGPPG